MLPPRWVHIKDLVAGDQLRIAMKPGYAIERPPIGTAQSPARGRRAFGWSRPVFNAFVISNDPVNGFMHVDAEVLAEKQPFSSKIEYGKILSIQKVIPYGRPVVETAPKSHPGAKALGTKLAQLLQQPYLVPVRFVGK